ncbi:PepSY-associated TM helix domain-containing protein [Paenibacillus sp. CAU 1782]
MSPTSRKRKASLYQSIWRWHFYAGIIFAPFLIILAFSGSVYLFKPQIEDYMYKDMLNVQKIGAYMMTTDDIIAKTEQAYPGTSIIAVEFSNHPEKTVKLTASRDGKNVLMYADPYSGNLLGILDSDKTFSAFFKKMHSELVIGGTWANRLVELAACWGIILVITGLYLWRPRNRSQIWGTILPRMSKPGSRQFWRDLHAVPAFWLSLFIVILIATGLPWSGVVGKQIDRLANSTNSNYPPYALSFMAKPESVTVAKDIAQDVPWASENLPVPASAAGGYIQLTVEAIKEIADKQAIAPPYTISLPLGEQGVYTIATSHSRPGDNATLHVDQYSGAVLTDVRFADYGLMAKGITMGIALHEGRLFGLPNQILGLITALGVILMAVSSCFMWRKRKPDGKLGAPARAKDKKTTISVLVIMLVFGAFMPLVGLSIIAIILLDWLAIRHIKPLKDWFSI